MQWLGIGAPVENDASPSHSDLALQKIRTNEADLALCALFDSRLQSRIDGVVDSHLEEELQEELSLQTANLNEEERSAGCPCSAVVLASGQRGAKYCQYVLRGDTCPKGKGCRYRHFAGNAEGVAPPGADDKENEALSCWICGNLFENPVTLPCGHTYDRHCLEVQETLRCPRDGTPYTLPLPEVDFVLRAYIMARFPSYQPGMPYFSDEEGSEESTLQILGVNPAAYAPWAGGMVAALLALGFSLAVRPWTGPWLPAIPPDR